MTSLANQKVSSTTIEIKNLKEQLSKKADDTWTKDMLDIQKNNINEVKGIALSTKKRLEGRVCAKEKTIEEMMHAIQSWKNVKIGVFITVFMLLAMGLAQFFTLKNQADNTEATQKAMGISVTSIEEAMEKNTVMFKEHVKASEDEKADKEEEKKELLEDIGEVVETKLKKSRRRN